MYFLFVVVVCCVVLFLIRMKVSSSAFCIVFVVFIVILYSMFGRFLGKTGSFGLGRFEASVVLHVAGCVLFGRWSSYASLYRESMEG